MILQFPPQPQSVGAHYDAPNGYRYIWDGEKWLADGNVNVNTNVLSGLITINPESVAKNQVATQTFTITGLTTGHHIVITPATALTYGIFISAAWASAANTLSIQFMNISGGAIDLGNIDINYFAWV
jgi:hypothetical protein